MAEVAELFADVPRWWVAGGYAIELAVGRAFRSHGDIDVLVLRRDLAAVQRALAGWELWAADPPGTLRPWADGEVLGPQVHDIWCRPGPDRPWRVQVMADEADGDVWVSRRNPALRRPVAGIGLRADGIPFLAPEIQLFYKAREPRAKDRRDFAEVVPLLGPAQRQWLSAAILETYGPHPWVSALDVAFGDS